jgi:hypothetical protein
MRSVLIDVDLLIDMAEGRGSEDDLALVEVPCLAGSIS